MKNTTINFGSENTEFIAIIPARSKRLASRIYEAANDEGTIQAWDARNLFPGNPQAHTTMSLANAFRQAGFTLREV